MINEFDKADSERWDSLPFYEKVINCAETIVKEMEQNDLFADSTEI